MALEAASVNVCVSDVRVGWTYELVALAERNTFSI
jgi:hypothetical protein